MTTTATQPYSQKRPLTPIQIGENFTGLPPMSAALACEASDYVMIDLDRIGGVTGWRSAAGLVSDGLQPGSLVASISRS
jgi:L-alanine-DL-glutamate epimerase-like enolase superfamily enzyme